jgi:hypothetical protein
MTLSGDTHAKFAILSFRPKACPERSRMGGEISFYFELWHAITVSGFISSQTVIVIPQWRDTFGRHDKSTQHGNISHLVANEVEDSLVGERFISRPEEAQLLEVSGQALCSPAKTRAS